MKTDQILAAAKKWAKENKYKISAKILKTAPEWVRSEDQGQGAGVAVTIPNIDPLPCKIWLSGKGNKNSFLYKSRGWDTSDFKSISKVDNTLSDALETHRHISIFNIIEEWANENDYEIGEEIGGGTDMTIYEYGRKDDPHVEEGLYPSTISFTAEGKLNIERKISESLWGHVATGKETKPDKIKKWLDEYAKTGLYTDYIITHLDKKTSRKLIMSSDKVIYLYNIESATDEAIQEMSKSKHGKEIHFSDLSYRSLSESQIIKLNKMVANKNGSLVIDSGVQP
jgi:hypothetical protein